jgi:hypothetical protein
MLDYFTMLEKLYYVTSNGRLTDKWCFRKDLEGSSLDLTEIPLFVIYVEGLKKPEEKSAGIAGVSTDIWSNHLRNTSLEHFRYTTLTDEMRHAGPFTIVCSGYHDITQVLRFGSDLAATSIKVIHYLLSCLQFLPDYSYDASHVRSLYLYPTTVSIYFPKNEWHKEDFSLPPCGDRKETKSPSLESHIVYKRIDCLPGCALHYKFVVFPACLSLRVQDSSLQCNKSEYYL